MTILKLHLGAFVIQLNVQSDRLSLSAEGPNGNARFMELVDGGGHFEVATTRDNADGAGLELDGDGRVIIHEN